MLGGVIRDPSDGHESRPRRFRAVGAPRVVLSPPAAVGILSARSGGGFGETGPQVDGFWVMGARDRRHVRDCSCAIEPVRVQEVPHLVCHFQVFA